MTTFDKILEVIKYENVLNYEVHKSGDIKIIEIGCEYILTNDEYDAVSQIEEDLYDMCSYVIEPYEDDEKYYIFNGFMVISHIN